VPAASTCRDLKGNPSPGGEFSWPNATWAGDTLSVGERDWGENHTIARAANRGGVRLRSETGNQHGEFVQTSHGAASGAAVRRAPIRYC
jgi:hypothetical protein